MESHESKTIMRQQRNAVLRVISAILLGVLGALLFFESRAGANIAVVAAALGAAHLLLVRPKPFGRTDAIWLGLFAVSTAASVVQVSMTNAVVLLALLAWRTASEFELGSAIWGKLVWAILNLPASVTRWVAVPGAFSSVVDLLREVSPWLRGLRGLLIAVPGFAVTVFFGVLLIDANAVLQREFASLAQSVGELLRVLRFNGLWFWIAGLLATLSLGVLWPWGFPQGTYLSGISEHLRPSTRPDRLRLVLIVLLVGVNGVFLLSNSAEAAFLWFGRELPAGMTHSSYVHEGTESLVAAALLAGFTLLVCFARPGSPRNDRTLKVLALFWIAQNIMLLAGAAKRLSFYIDAYGWTLLRYNLAVFYVLVGLGFCVLAYFVFRERCVDWLLSALAILLFGILFAGQFVNAREWVAEANTESYLSGRVSQIDTYHLAKLGPSA